MPTAAQPQFENNAPPSIQHRRIWITCLGVLVLCLLSVGAATGHAQPIASPGFEVSPPEAEGGATAVDAFLTYIGARGRPRPALLLGAFALMTCLFALGIGLRPRASPYPANGPGKTARSPLFWYAVAGLAICYGIALLDVSQLRFYHDDFLYLVNAQTGESDANLRYVSAGLHFRLGSEFANPKRYFMAANVLALTAFLVGYYRLLRRLGVGQLSALLSVSVTLFAPGLFELLAWATGFQVIAAYALIAWTTLCVANVQASKQLKNRAAWGALALAFTTLILFTKYRLAVLIPALSVLVSLRGRNLPGARATFWLLVPIAGLPTALVLLLLPDSESADAFAGVGFAAVGSNMLQMLQCLRFSLTTFALWAVTIAIVPPLVRREGLGHLRFARRGQALGVVAFSLLAALLAAAPYLLHEAYFPPYYAILPHAILAPLVAILACRALRNRHAVLRAALLAALPGLLVVMQLRTHGNEFMSDPGQRGRALLALEAFHADIRAAAAGAGTLCEVELRARCEGTERQAESTDMLAAMLSMSERGSGVRWATGLPHLTVSWSGDDQHGRFEGRDTCSSPAGRLTLDYCVDSGVRVTAPE